MPFQADLEFLKECFRFQVDIEQTELENEFSLKRKRYDEFVSLVGISALSEQKFSSELDAILEGQKELNTFWEDKAQYIKKFNCLSKEMLDFKLEKKLVLLLAKYYTAVERTKQQAYVNVSWDILNKFLKEHSELLGIQKYKFYIPQEKKISNANDADCVVS